MAKIIVCKTCGKEIAKSAKACPHCGAKQKPGCLRSVLATFLLVFGIAMILGALGGDDYAQPTEPQISEAEYKAQCVEIAYEDLARNPDDHAGEFFKFTGEVVQVLQNGNTVNLRLNVTPVYFGEEVSYYDDTIYVILHLPDGADRILEDDIITLYGTCNGLHTYTSVLGAEVSIPGIEGMYYELIK